MFQLYFSVSDDDEEADVTDDQIHIEAATDDVPDRKPEPMSNPAGTSVHLQVCPGVEEEEHEGHGGHVKVKSAIAGEDDDDDQTQRAQLHGQAEGVYQEGQLGDDDDDDHQPAKRRLVDKKEEGTMGKGKVQSKIVAYFKLTNAERARPVKTQGEHKSTSISISQNNSKRKAPDYDPEQGPAWL